MDTATKTRKAQPFAIMLTDLDTLDWVMIQKGGLDEARIKFNSFHKKPCGKNFAAYACHPDTKWDGAGGYSIPHGEFAPVLVGTNGRTR